MVILQKVSLQKASLQKISLQKVRLQKVSVGGFFHRSQIAYRSKFCYK